MPAPTFDAYAARVKQLYPQADDGEIASVYQQRFGLDPVRSQGPSLDDYRARAKQLYPNASDAEIEGAYDQRYGVGFGTTLARAAKSGLGQLGALLGRGITGLESLTGGNLAAIPAVPGMPVAGAAAQDPASVGPELEQSAQQYQAVNAPAAAVATAPWYNPTKIAGQVVETGVGMVPQLLSGSAGLGAAIGGAQEGVPYYDRLVAQGMPKAEAAVRAGLYGTATIPLNMLGLSRILNRTPGRILTGVTEAVTEAAEEPLGALIEGKSPGEALATIPQALREVGPASFLLGVGLGASGKPGQYDAKAWAERVGLGQVEPAAPTAPVEIPNPAAAQPVQEAQQAADVLAVDSAGVARPATQGEQAAPDAAQEAARAEQTRLERIAVGLEPLPVSEDFRSFERAIAPRERRALWSMRQDAEAYLPTYQQTLQELAQEITGDAGNAMVPPLKGWDRVVEKVVGEYRGQTNGIRDMVRGTLLVNNPAQAEAAWGRLQEAFGGQVPGTTARRSLLDMQPDKFGYADIKINVPGPNGRAYEVQVTTPELFRLKEGEGHQLYERARSIQAKAVAENRQVHEAERAEIFDLQARSRELYRPGLEAYQAAEAVSRDSGRPSTTTVQPGIGPMVKEPSGSTSSVSISSGDTQNLRPSNSQGVQPGPGRMLVGLPTEGIIPEGQAPEAAPGDITVTPAPPKDEGPPAAASRGPAGQGSAASQLQQSLAPVMAGWDPAVAPRVVIVQNSSQLPPHVLKALGPQVRGASDLPNRTVYLVADGLESSATARKVLEHEVVGHYGLQRLMGDRWPWLLERVQALTKKDPIIRKVADRVRGTYGQLDPNTEAAEILAHLAETSPKHPLVEKVIAWMREALRKLGFPVNLNRQDVIALINRAGASLQRSGQVSGQSEPGKVYASRAPMDKETVGGRGSEDATGIPRPDRVDLGGGSYSMAQFGGLTDAQAQTLVGVMQTMEAPTAEQRRGTRSWDATEQAAAKLIRDKFGITLEQLVHRKPGSTANAEQMEAYGTILAEASQAVHALAQRARETKSNEDLANLALARERLGMLVAPAMGYRTEAGRALNILRKQAADLRTAQDLLDAMGDGTRNTLEDFAERIGEAQTLDQVIGLTRANYAPTLWDKFYEYWVNGLLSGPVTHQVNVLSNALYRALEEASGAVGSVVTPNYSLRQTAARMAAMPHGVAMGLKNMRQAFLTEEPQLDPAQKIEAARHRAIGGTLGKVVRLPGRFLTAEDEFFKAIGYHAELADQAMGEAIREAPADPMPAFHRIMGDVLNRPEMIKKAREAANRGTFTNPLGPLGNIGMHYLNKSKVGKLIVPFVRTPTNILKAAIDYTPAGVARGETRRALIGEGAPRDIAMARGRMLIGSTVITGAISLAAQGMLSGHGPEDDRERALLQRTGWQPYSVKVGDTWVKYNRFDPLGTVLGLAADLYELGGYLRPGDYEKIPPLLLTSLALNLGDKTFLRGVTDFAQAYADPGRYLQDWAQGLAGTAVPTVVAQVGQAQDPYIREANSLVEAVRARIPGEREKLARRVDIGGEPIRSKSAGFGIPFQVSEQKTDVLADTMLRLGLNKDKPDRKIQGVDLTPEEYESFATALGQARFNVLTPLVGSPQFRQIVQSNPEAARALLNRQWERISDQARTLWLYRNPSVLTRAQAQRLQPRARASQYLQ